jgi:hypothetical protein
MTIRCVWLFALWQLIYTLRLAAIGALNFDMILVYTVTAIYRPTLSCHRCPPWNNCHRPTLRLAAIYRCPPCTFGLWFGYNNCHRPNLSYHRCPPYMWYIWVAIIGPSYYTFGYHHWCSRRSLLCMWVSTLLPQLLPTIYTFGYQHCYHALTLPIFYIRTFGCQHYCYRRTLGI